PGTNTVPVVSGANAVTYEKVPNVALANNSVTVTAGTGLSGGGAIALGASATLNNAGVLTVTAAGPIASSGGQNPNITLGTVGVGNGGTGLTSSGVSGNYLRSNAGLWTSSALLSGDLPAIAESQVTSLTADLAAKATAV